jgi:hypothetical protein
VYVSNRSTNKLLGMPNWKKVIVSGSNASLNSLTVANGITGSLFGTASFAVSASQAISSSYTLSASYAATSSYATTFDVATSFTASGLNYPTVDGLEYQNIQTNGDGVLSFDYTKTLYKKIHNGETSSIVKGTPLFISGSQGDLSIVYIADANNPARMPATVIAYDNSLAPATEGTAIILGLITNVNTTGYPPGTAVYVGSNGGWTATPPTGSAIVQPLGIVTRTGTNGAGIVLTTPPNSLPNIQSGYVWVGDANGVPQAIPTSSIQNVISSSFATNAANAISSSYGATSSYADSFTVKNNAIISGSLTIYQNLTVFGSASITYVSESTLNIGTNLITVNSNTPAVRFGGLAVIDSGSSPQKSGSWLFDSTQDRWIMIHQNPVGSAITSSIGIMGPETYNNLGNETQITLNRLTKGYSGASGEHIGDSQISDDGTTVSIPGKLVVTGSITGSLFGTASYAVQAATASYFITSSVTSASFATSASYASSSTQTLTASFVNPLIQSVLITGSLNVTGSTILSGSLTLPTFSSGSVLFAGTNGLVSQDNTNFFWDDANNRLGIGTSSLQGALHVNSDTTAATNALVITRTGVAFADANVRLTNGTNQAGQFVPYFWGTSNFLGGSPAYAIGMGFVGAITNASTQDLGLVFNARTKSATALTQGWIVNFSNSATDYVRIAYNGNMVLQNGGTFTDTGERLQVSGSAKITNGLTVTGSLTVFTGSSVEFQVTNTGVKIGNAITDSNTVTGSLNVSGSVTATNFTGSLFGTSSFATSASYAATSSYAYNFTVANQLTATTLIVQTVSSSVVYSSGSNVFGNQQSNTQVFTGSVNITGSLTTNGGEIFAGRIDNGSEGGQVSFGRALDNNNGWYIDVYGNTSTPSLRFVDVSTAAVRMTISGSGAITMGQSLAVGPINPSAVAGRIDASNDVVAFSTSDSRFKENIQVIPNALDKIDKIHGYTFDWKEDKNLNIMHGFVGHDVGIIAQEIEEVLPEVVITRDNGYKAVKYEKIVPLLIQCIKELKDEIRDLKSQN